MRKDVREVIELCRSLGLQPVMESASGHYKVRDPKTNTFLFGISSSPSDPNWRWMIMRHLRRLGLLRQGKKQRGPTQKSAIDLVALKKAQDAAASAGHHIPALDDLEDSTEFFTRIRKQPNVTEYSADAQEEVIDIMSPRVEAPRLNATRQRLAKALDAHRSELVEAAKGRGRKEGKKVSTQGAEMEFVRVAIEEVAPKRGLRAWPNESAGYQSVRTFLKGSGISLWAVNLIEATMDHIDGLKWGEIDESRKIPQDIQELYDDLATPKKEPEIVEPDEEVRTRIEDDIHVHPIETSDDHIRERYAETLLELLANSSESIANKKPILERLDKLAGMA